MKDRDIEIVFKTTISNTNANNVQNKNGITAFANLFLKYVLVSYLFDNQ